MHNRLPTDMIKKVLFNLKVDDVSEYCQTNQAIRKFCESNDFWLEYIENNFDIGELMEIFGVETRPEIFTYLESYSSSVKSLQNLTPKYKSFAKWLDESKIIRHIHVNYRCLPILSGRQIISRFSVIGNFVQRGSSLFGEKFSIYLDRANYMVIDLHTGETIDVLDTNYLFKDLKYGGMTLFDHIDTWITTQEYP